MTTVRYQHAFSLNDTNQKRLEKIQQKGIMIIDIILKGIEIYENDLEKKDKKK